MEPEKKKIKAREFVKDLRGGIDDEALMNQYALSRAQFHKLLGMAVDSGLLDKQELYARISHSMLAGCYRSQKRQKTFGV